MRRGRLLNWDVLEPRPPRHDHPVQMLRASATWTACLLAGFLHTQGHGSALGPMACFGPEALADRVSWSMHSVMCPHSSPLNSEPRKHLQVPNSMVGFLPAFKIHERGRARTGDLQIRSLTRYPLRHTPVIGVTSLMTFCSAPETTLHISLVIKASWTSSAVCAPATISWSSPMQNE